MAKYSSDSESDYSKYRRRRLRRSRSSSSDSSDSSPHRKRSSKYSKTKRRHHSRSRSRGRDRDRSQRSYKSSRRSNSKDRDKRRYRSSRGRSRSSENSRRKGRSTSREKSSGSRSSSSQCNVKAVVPDKPQVAITKDNAYDFNIEPRFKEGVLEEINSEGFAPKQFTSSGNKEKKFQNIVIDISADTIQLPIVPEVSIGPESIFHASVMMDQEARFDKWVKKLYTLRQKAIVDLLHSNSM